MAGGMGVRKNVHIEEWASFRENCEHVFKFSKANWARLAVFGIAVPVGLYVWITKEMVSGDSEWPTFKDVMKITTDNRTFLFSFAMEQLSEGHSVGLGPERLGYQRKYMGFPPAGQKDAN